MHSYSLLIVDDSPLAIEGLKIAFQDNYAVKTVSSGEAAIELVKSDDSIGVIVMDIRMSGMNGIDAARVIRDIAPEIPVIFHTAYPGQYDEDEIHRKEKPSGFVIKGDSEERLKSAVRVAMENFELKQECKRLISRAETDFKMIGSSPVMKEIYQKILKVGPSESKVMILGETGTGKELVARAIHRISYRRDKPLAIFNCNHRNPDLVDSELFGHLKGSFTDAQSDRVGLFEYGNTGTVFLDEIGDLDIETQGKVLRVLESGEYSRLGENESMARKTDVRLMCATHHDLRSMVESGKFRQDLFYRLKGVMIELPPLKDRKEDIPALVSEFVEQCATKEKCPSKVFDESAISAMLGHDWPGNVRELKDAIESLVVLTESYLITSADVESYLGLQSPVHSASSTGTSLTERMRDFRRNCIVQALDDSGGVVNVAARMLQVDPSNLRKWMRDLEIESGN